MATSSLPANASVEQWDEKLFQEYFAQNFFTAMSGTGQNMPIVVKEQLTRTPGGTINVHLRRRLTNGALSQNDVMRGNEERLDLRTQAIQINESKNAVSWKTFDEQLTAIQLRETVKDALHDWIEEENRDLIINALGSINGVNYADASETQKDAYITDNNDRVLFGSSKSNYTSGDHSASLAAVDNTSDKLTSSALSLMKRMAATANPQIRPFKVRQSVGKSDGFIALVGTRVLRDLKDDAAFQQANREARNRGIANPIFNSADFMYDNIAIYEIPDLPNISNAGSGGIDVSPVYLLGAQAVGQAWAKRPSTVTRDDLDYNSEYGCMVKQWIGVEKLRFGTGTDDREDQKDAGVVTGWFAAVDD